MKRLGYALMALSALVGLNAVAKADRPNMVPITKKFTISDFPSRRKYSIRDHGFPQIRR